MPRLAIAALARRPSERSWPAPPTRTGREPTSPKGGPGPHGRRGRPRSTCRRRGPPRRRSPSTRTSTDVERPDQDPPGQAHHPRQPTRARRCCSSTSRRKCGLTPQYSALEALQKKYEREGLHGHRLPVQPVRRTGARHAPRRSQTFCSTTYGVTFPMMEKIEVNGAGRHEIYKELTPLADAERPHRRHPVELREVRGLRRRHADHALLAEDHARRSDGDRGDRERRCRSELRARRDLDVGHHRVVIARADRLLAVALALGEHDLAGVDRAAAVLLAAWSRTRSRSGDRDRASAAGGCARFSLDHVMPSAGPSPGPGSRWRRSHASWKCVRRPPSVVSPRRNRISSASGVRVEVAAQDLRRAGVGARARGSRRRSRAPGPRARRRRRAGSGGAWCGPRSARPSVATCADSSMRASAGAGAAARRARVRGSTRAITARPSSPAGSLPCAPSSHRTTVA